MERTARVVIFALFLELYPRVNEVDDIGTSQQVINKDTWDSSSHKPHLPVNFLLAMKCDRTTTMRGKKRRDVSS